MRDGWLGTDYLTLFDDDEIPVLTERYGVAARLPGYSVIGLRSWDDFVLKDERGDIVTVPAVPASAEYMQPFALASDGTALLHDGRLHGLIKWYVTPLVFGGDPADGPNLTWVTLETHIELVRWWNAKYDEVTAIGK